MASFWKFAFYRGEVVPLSTQCNYLGNTISVAQALLLKGAPNFVAGKGVFTCPECNGAVRPHQAGGSVNAHFEHLRRTPKCSLSYKPKPKDNNPDWLRDELILALALYLKHRPNPPGKTSEEVAALSATLRKIAARLHPSFQLSPTFRNPNGVYMKLMNFRSLDPEYTNAGNEKKKGLERGSAADESVWAEFVGTGANCGEVAKAIISGIDTMPSDLVIDIPDDVEEASEGRVLTKTHIYRERDRRIVQRKIKSARGKNRSLECEVCGFDFQKIYGSHGDGFIECHHKKPLSTLGAEAKTSINDLALVCSNCHRMIHRKKPWLSIESLKGLLGQ